MSIKLEIPAGLADNRATVRLAEVVEKVLNQGIKAATQEDTAQFSRLKADNLALKNRQQQALKRLDAVLENLKNMPVNTNGGH
jgi:hypothetical protein